MLPDRVSNPGPLTYESGALPIALRGPALSDEDMDMDTMITTYNTAVTDAASEILGKERRRKKPWVTKDVLDLCDERRDLKKKRYEAEGAK